MQRNLMADSSVYASDAELYDLFSTAEDADGKVFTALLPHIQGRSVLDVGCGTGKYVALFAPHARHITGVDAAAAQLAVAKNKNRPLGNVTLVEGDAATAPLPQPAYDVILSTWAIGTILDPAHRQAVLARMYSLLAPGGRIFLVENDLGGDFEEIRGRNNDPQQRTKTYNDFLQAEGFAVHARIDARFVFASDEAARAVFQRIWGDAAAARVPGHEIGHKIIIFTKTS